jgi:hypothetical protein
MARIKKSERKQVFIVTYPSIFAKHEKLFFSFSSDALVKKLERLSPTCTFSRV